MPRKTTACWIAALPFLALLSAIHAQTKVNFDSLPRIGFEMGGPVLRAGTEARKPFTVAGERGVLVGQQDGSFEAWVLPIKLLSHMTIEANIQDYTVPIEVNQQAAEIEVHPDRTVITYTHIGFTVRQIMFSPDDAPPGAGPVVLYQFDCLKPTDFVFRFTPDLLWMWPERNEGVPGVEWVAPGPNPHNVPGGFYVLHSDYPDLAGAVTIPGALPGILAPYQERPQVHPVELKLHIDPVRDRGRLYPLLMAVGTDKTSANSGNLAKVLEQENASIAATYAAHSAQFQKLLTNSVSIQTPDEKLNEAFQWAEISIEQLKAKPQGTDETALVAGYYESGDSARPGFGWFFGRDALYTLYAVNGFGDFGLSRSELEFLIHRQRADGKIMHEYSQTAAAIDWKAFPYMYAAADATPLFLLAVADYVKASGDLAFLKEHQDAIEKAWAFETSHASGPEQGGNGIYTNAQGTGWVESWPGGMPHQEVYLALLDQQASAAMGVLEHLLGDQEKADAARQRAEAIAKTINAQFYDGQKGCYAFSRNTDGSLDRTTTVYPSLAWWSGKSILDHGEECLRQFATAALDTDWGLRDVSNHEKIYDGMSYHRGSVWPLFTGWGALAEYRGGQPLAGYEMLMENANLTHAQDLGAVTELLSGDYFVPFGRSTSHQLWSSAMVIIPTLRGLFGIDIDAQVKSITVNPRLPAGWGTAQVSGLPLPGGRGTLTFTKRGDQLEVELSGEGTQGWTLRNDLPGRAAKPGSSRRQGSADPHAMSLALPALEVDPLLTGLDVRKDVQETLPDRLPLPGARTERFRVVREQDGDHKLTLTVEGRGGSQGCLGLVAHGRFTPKVQVDGADPDAVRIAPRKDPANTKGEDELDLRFPAGDGWKSMTITFTW